MFSNNLIRSLCKSSDEMRLNLSPIDWEIVLNANKFFSESEGELRGNKLWGKYLLSKVQQVANVDFSSSLELCCGSGFLFFSFVDQFNLEGESYFMDLSFNQCTTFNRRCDDSQVKRPNVLCGDIGTLPFRNSSFKLVYGNSFLHHLPDVLAYLREIHRVLVDGGKFIVFHEPSLTATFWESFPISLYKDTSTASLTDIWNISPSVITQLLSESGFSRIEISPSNLISSILITPLQIILSKLSLSSNATAIVRMKIFCDRIERFLPKRMRYKYAPSVSIYAEK